MGDLTVKTNGARRDVLSWHDLSERERAEFDYLDTDERRDGASFFRYRGAVYDLGEFQRAPDDLKPWDGYAADTYFSGVVVRLSHDGERVRVGRYFS